MHRWYRIICVPVSFEGEPGARLVVETRRRVPVRAEPTGKARGRRGLLGGTVGGVGAAVGGRGGGGGGDGEGWAGERHPELGDERWRETHGHVEPHGVQGRWTEKGSW